MPQVEFGQDAANHALVHWKLLWAGDLSESGQAAAPSSEQRLRGFSLTTTFSDTGAFLRGLPFNYWYHQLLLGFSSYIDTVTGVTAAKKPTQVSEILF